MWLGKVSNINKRAGEIIRAGRNLFSILVNVLTKIRSSRWDFLFKINDVPALVFGTLEYSDTQNYEK